MHWAADGDCLVLDPAALVTQASCATPGPHVFTLLADDGAQAASDAVRIEATREAVVPLYEGTGTSPVPQLGVARLPGRTFHVPAGLARMVARLDWEGNGVTNVNLDLVLSNLGRTEAAATDNKPEVLTVAGPAAGAWTARVDGRTATNTPWTLTVTGIVEENAVTLPRFQVPRATADLGESVTLTARVEGAASPYSIAWETDPASRRFDDGAGSTLTLVAAGPQVVRAKLTDALGRELVAEGSIGLRGALAEPLTVVAVIDNWFAPYHYDFLGERHPWNLDADPANDHDFQEYPPAYVPGMPNVTTLPLTLPQSADEDVELHRLSTDAALWTGMASSSLAAPRPYWFPGTKVVAALRFGPEPFHAGETVHGTKSASVAAGNVHGACPECLLVLISAEGDQARDEALSWASRQRWIDVVTNSYGTGHPVLNRTPVRDGMYWRAPVNATRDASEAGQTIVFSAGNGLANAYDAPPVTYWSSQRGPDWVVTVGSVAAHSNWTFSGSGKPVDVSAIGNRYPSMGGSTANGTGTHGGTSNAAPVVAGYFAKVVHEARRALGDATPGHAGGVVASGTPVACGAAVPQCALGDGVLTRVELEDVVYASVRAVGEPVNDASFDPIWPETEHAYFYQGHGALTGRFWGEHVWRAEWTRMVEHARGEAEAYPKTDAMRNWFVVDSKCRQRLWGAWSGGDWQGQQPDLHPVRDPIATKVDTWCSRAPERPFR